MAHDTSHLVALMSGLASERKRLAAAKSDGEKALRSVWVRQLEAEVAAEEKFLADRGAQVFAAGTHDEMTDDELLALLQ